MDRGRNAHLGYMPSVSGNQSIASTPLHHPTERGERQKGGSEDNCSLLLTNFAQLRVSEVYCQSTYCSILAPVYDEMTHLISKQGSMQSINYTPITQIHFVVFHFLHTSGATSKCWRNARKPGSSNSP